jgi:putative aldouronate transport system substrate-binding protein
VNADGYTVPDVMLRNLDDLINANAVNDEAIVVWITNGAGSEEHVEQQLTATWGYDVIALPIHQDYYFSSNWAAGGNGVTASSAHPVEALKFLQLINTEAGEEIYNTIVYGLEGVEYEKIDDTHIKTLEYDGPQASDNSYSAHKWIMGNTFHAWLNQACSDQDNEIAMQINEATDNVVSPTMGFRFDNSAVTTELDQINAVVAEYFDTLRLGAKGADWEGYYNEFVEKMNAAGVEKVQNEIQTQFDAFLASK